MSTENSQTSIQSRGEQKARKAILALGLKPVAGVNRVTFTRGRGVSFFFLSSWKKVQMIDILF